MIERAEEYVRSRGFSVFRVRFLVNPGDQPVAKLQIAPDEMKKFPSLERDIQEALRAIGFRDLVVDPDGYQAPAALGSKASHPLVPDPRDPKYLF